MVSTSPRSVAGTPRSSAAKRTRKTCSTRGCTKVDAGGGHCVAHGGGKKCQYPGCHKGYQTGGFCRQHGGGARCQVEGCGKVDAGKGLCRAHGGGKRCQVESCTKADVGGGFCTAHGGGRRCAEPGCTKIDQGGGKCRAHGGARRCSTPGCGQPARGATGLCSDHGGALLCAAANCRRLVKKAGTTLCTACIKDQQHVKREDDGHQGEVEDAEEEEDDSGFQPMPPFSSLLMDATRFIDSTPASSATPSPATPQTSTITRDLILSDVPVDTAMSNLSSCLDNGCSRSFGGRCNCKEGCTCCARARSAEQSTGSTSNTAATAASVESISTPSPLPLVRIKLLVTSPPSVPISLVRGLVQGMPLVRSVHEQQQTSEDAESALLVIRGDPGLSLHHHLDLLAAIGVAYTVHSESTVDWPLKEIVLKVPEMMCPGNCGRTVINALLAVPRVHRATLAFDERCVIVCGEMGATALCEAVDATGFEPFVTSETPLPLRFSFRVQDLTSVHLLGHRLQELLANVEGVESVVLLVDRAEVLVVATLADAGSLLRAANAQRIMMVEVPSDAISAPPLPSPFDPARPGEASSVVVDSDAGDHVCDVALCPSNGCEQYRATVAHTAALAVGWSVPGCAMSWGGECTCGENCKCVGCPEHNPLP